MSSIKVSPEGEKRDLTLTFDQLNYIDTLRLIGKNIKTTEAKLLSAFEMINSDESCKKEFDKVLDRAQKDLYDLNTKVNSVTCQDIIDHTNRLLIKSENKDKIRIALTSYLSSPTYQNKLSEIWGDEIKIQSLRESNTKVVKKQTSTRQDQIEFSKLEYEEMFPTKSDDLKLEDIQGLNKVKTCEDSHQRFSGEISLNKDTQDFVYKSAKESTEIVLINKSMCKLPDSKDPNTAPEADYYESIGFGRKYIFCIEEPDKESNPFSDPVIKCFDHEQPTNEIKSISASFVSDFKRRFIQSHIDEFVIAVQKKDSIEILRGKMEEGYIDRPIKIPLEKGQELYGFKYNNEFGMVAVYSEITGFTLIYYSDKKARSKNLPVLMKQAVQGKELISMKIAFRSTDLPLPFFITVTDATININYFEQVSNSGTLKLAKASRNLKDEKILRAAWRNGVDGKTELLLEVRLSGNNSIFKIAKLN